MCQKKVASKIIRIFFPQRQHTIKRLLIRYLKRKLDESNASQANEKNLELVLSEIRAIKEANEKNLELVLSEIRATKEANEKNLELVLSEIRKRRS